MLEASLINIFLRVFVVWNGYHPAFLAALLSKAFQALNASLHRTRMGCGKIQLFLSSKHFSILQPQLQSVFIAQPDREN